MKNVMQLLSLAILLLNSAAVQAKPGCDQFPLEYNKKNPLLSLYTECLQNELSALDTILNKTAAGEDPKKKFPLVIYIHGRGKEPNKSFFGTEKDGSDVAKGRVIPKIQEMGVRVIGFNWDSWSGKAGRPYDKAVASAGDFVLLVKALQEHRKNNPAFWDNRSLVLHAHSMGGQVLRTALPQLKNQAVLFDRIMLTAMDVPAKDHADWLKGQSIASETIAISNPNDGILFLSGVGSLFKARLGRLEPGDKTQLASDVKYFSIPDKPKVKTHRYFTIKGAGQNAFLCEFVRAGFRGNELPKTKPAAAVGKIIPLAHSTDDPNHCLTKGSIDDDEEEDE